MGAVKLSRITIVRAEGPIAMCEDSMCFTSWDSANEWLRRQGETFPKLGYNKHDFTVEWEDGQLYSGRLDCRHPSCEDNDLDIRKHIIGYLIWYAGLEKTPYCGEEKYQLYLRNLPPGLQAELAEMLNKYFMED